MGWVFGFFVQWRKSRKALARGRRAHTWHNQWAKSSLALCSSSRDDNLVSRGSHWQPPRVAFASWFSSGNSAACILSIPIFTRLDFPNLCTRCKPRNQTYFPRNWFNPLFNFLHVRIWRKPFFILFVIALRVLKNSQSCTVTPTIRSCESFISCNYVLLWLVTRYLNHYFNVKKFGWISEQSFSEKRWRITRCPYVASSTLKYCFVNTSYHSNLKHPRSEDSLPIY